MTGDFRHEPLTGQLAAWGTKGEIQDFVIEHGLVITMGTEASDELAMTARGRALGVFLTTLAAVEAVCALRRARDE